MFSPVSQTCKFYEAVRSRRGAKVCCRWRWQKTKSQNREKVLSVSLVDMQKHVWGLRSRHGRWRWGIMRGFTGLIITPAGLKSPRPIRIGRGAGGEQSALCKACCLLFLWGRQVRREHWCMQTLQSITSTSHPHPQQRSRCSGQPPEIPYYHRRARKTETQGRQKDGENTFTACPAKCLMPSPHGRTQFIRGSDSPHIWPCRCALGLCKLLGAL